MLAVGVYYVEEASPGSKISPWGTEKARSTLAYLTIMIVGL
jgi:hypothetical protein